LHATAVGASPADPAEEPPFATPPAALLLPPWPVAPPLDDTVPPLPVAPLPVAPPVEGSAPPLPVTPPLPVAPPLLQMEQLPPLVLGGGVEDAEQRPSITSPHTLVLAHSQRFRVSVGDTSKRSRHALTHSFKSCAWGAPHTLSRTQYALQA
jgi:hypothetical protein